MSIERIIRNSNLNVIKKLKNQEKNEIEQSSCEKKRILKLDKIECKYQSN